MAPPKLLLPPAQSVLDLLPRAFDPSKFGTTAEDRLYWTDYISSELRTITSGGFNVNTRSRPKLHPSVKDRAQLTPEFLRTVNPSICAQLPDLINSWTWSYYGENWHQIYQFFRHLSNLKLYRGQRFETVNLKSLIAEAAAQ